MWNLSIVILVSCLVSSCFPAEVCYGTCGCFSDDPPYDGLALPESPTDQQLVYELYTRTNPDIPVNVAIPDIGEPDVPDIYDPANPTVFLIHGWLSTPRDMDNIKDAFLQSAVLPDYNVIIVDWSTGASSLYDSAVSNLRVTGACAGAVASAFQGAELATVHCTGHSLGGQTCGQMGKFVQKQRQSLLGRISGLDEAIPNFDTDDLRVRLDKSDAAFVDIIRTTEMDSQNIAFPYDVGHVTFIPNMARDQPGCGSANWNCRHWQCVYFYADSIRNYDTCPYTANQCDSFEDAELGLCNTCIEGETCQRMGFFSSDFPRGQFYLTTVEGPPYCSD